MKPIAQRLSNMFNLKPGEERVTILTLLLSFFIGLSVIFLYASSRALFLTYFDAKDLAYVFIAVAICFMVIGFVFSKATQLISWKNLTVIIYFLFISTLILFRVWFALYNKSWGALVLAIWFDVFMLLSNLLFWGLCNRIFHMQQAKRLYGLIGSGEFLAIFIGGIASKFLSRWFGAANLLLFCMIAILIALFLTLKILKLISKSNQIPINRPKRIPGQSRVQLTEPYILMIHLFWGVSIVVLCLTDAAFANQAELNFLNSDELAGFLGLFYSEVSLIVLVVRSVLSGKIIEWLGVIKVFFLLPVSILVVVVPFVLTAHFYPFSPLIFVFTVMLRLFDYVLRYSFHKPAFLVLYQPLPKKHRTRVQASVESFAEPLAILFVGGAILLLRKYFEINAANISIAIIGVVSIWLILIFYLRRQYQAKLLDVLESHEFKDSNVSFQDQLSLSLIARRLESKNHSEVIYAIDLLEKFAPDTVAPIIIGLLFHPSSFVVLHCLHRIEHLKLADAKDHVLEIMTSSKSVQILAAAIKTYGVIARTEGLETIKSYLKKKHPQIQIATISTLIGHCGIEGTLAAGYRLMRMVKDTDKTQKKIAAYAIGQIGRYDFYRPLIPLLIDPNSSVRRAALVAAENVRHPNLVDNIMINLWLPEYRGLAMKAIASIGFEALEVLAAEFLQPNKPRHIQYLTIKSIARIPGTYSTEKLVDYMFFPEATIRLTVLKQLQKRQYQALEIERGKIQAHIRKEAETATWLLIVLTIIPDVQDHRLLKSAINDEINCAISRIFALLSFIFPAESIVEAQKHLNFPDLDHQAYAFEIIDNMLPNPIKKFLFPFLQDIPVSNKIQELNRMFPQKQMNLTQSLMTLYQMADQSIFLWTKIATVYSMGKLAQPTFITIIDSAIKSEDCILQETAYWARENIMKNIQGSVIPNKVTDQSPTALLTVEKVLLLSSLGIFSNLSGDTLTEISPYFGEEKYRSGEMVFEMGKFGTDMYIVASGVVKVHIDDQVIAILKKGDVFGELSALDPEERSASVSVVEDSLLLKLDHYSLYEMIFDHADVAKNIIQFLCRRYRTTVGSKEEPR